jgi:hypothetical protein
LSKANPMPILKMMLRLTDVAADDGEFHRRELLGR